MSGALQPASMSSTVWQPMAGLMKEIMLTLKHMQGGQGGQAPRVNTEEEDLKNLTIFKPNPNKSQLAKTPLKEHLEQEESTQEPDSESPPSSSKPSPALKAPAAPRLPVGNQAAIVKQAMMVRAAAAKESKPQAKATAKATAKAKAKAVAKTCTKQATAKAKAKAKGRPAAALERPPMTLPPAATLWWGAGKVHTSQKEQAWRVFLRTTDRVDRKIKFGPNPEERWNNILDAMVRGSWE